jgi:hypothetical protein
MARRSKIIALLECQLQKEKLLLIQQRRQQQQHH